MCVCVCVQWNRQILSTNFILRIFHLFSFGIANKLEFFINVFAIQSYPSTPPSAHKHNIYYIYIIYTELILIGFSSFTLISKRMSNATNFHTPFIKPLLYTIQPPSSNFVYRASYNFLHLFCWSPGNITIDCQHYKMEKSLKTWCVKCFVVSCTQHEHHGYELGYGGFSSHFLSDKWEKVK